MHRFALISTAALAALATLSGCANQAPTMQAAARPYMQDSLPDAVKVPAGHRVVMETTGVGEITYECRVKAQMTDAFEWVFVGPKAVLKDRSGKQVGTYYGPPATWESADGSKLTGVQLAVAPAMPGSIPLQLVKANAASATGAAGSGAMNGAFTGISHIQRVATRGGVAPAAPCGMANVGSKQVVNYQADYIFYKPA